MRLLETSGKSAARLERELGIGTGCLSRWKQEFAEYKVTTKRNQAHPVALNLLRWDFPPEALRVTQTEASDRQGKENLHP